MSKTPFTGTFCTPISYLQVSHTHMGVVLRLGLEYLHVCLQLRLDPASVFTLRTMHAQIRLKHSLLLHMACPQQQGKIFLKMTKNHSSREMHTSDS
jgi:hypothetical protein